MARIAYRWTGKATVAAQGLWNSKQSVCRWKGDILDPLTEQEREAGSQELGRLGLTDIMLSGEKGEQEGKGKHGKGLCAAVESRADRHHTEGRKGEGRNRTHCESPLCCIGLIMFDDGNFNDIYDSI